MLLPYYQGLAQNSILQTLVELRNLVLHANPKNHMVGLILSKPGIN
jgi:hypothetical protein